jgi:hypothetical protein
MEKYGRARHDVDENIKWCMRFVCWILKVIYLYLEYVILIIFVLQQRLHERAAVLHYTHVASLALLQNNVLKRIWSQEAVHTWRFPGGSSNTSKSNLRGRVKGSSNLDG